LVSEAASRQEDVARLGGMGVDYLSEDGAVMARRPRFDALARRLGGRRFDLAILGPYWIFNQYSSFLRWHSPDCHQVLDTIDLHHVRLQREAELRDDDQRRREAQKVLKQEIQAARLADSVWVVSEAERLALQVHCDPTLSSFIIPTIHPIDDATESQRPRGRHGVVFLGGYQHAPNVDAVHFFFREILPTLRRELPRLRVTVAGSDTPPEIFAYHDPSRSVFVPGYVPDHRRLLRSHRVGIAPLRYGAGVKGKIYEYLACDLPCVTTTVGAEGMGLVDGVNALLRNEPSAFAEAIAHLHGDDCLWERLRSHGKALVRAHVSPAAVNRSLSEALNSAARMRHAPSREHAALVQAAQRAAFLDEAYVTRHAEKYSDAVLSPQRPALWLVARQPGRCTSSPPAHDGALAAPRLEFPDFPPKAGTSSSIVTGST
jgi:glycosyltransferase involved in cell wall biosynthesis